MDNHTSNEINMLRSSDNCLHTYHARYSTFTALVNYVTDLDGVLTIIDAKESIVNGITSGQTTDKANKCLAMVTVALQIAGAGYAYASDNGDDILLAKMDVTKSDFSKKVDGDDASLADMIYNTINPIIGSLTNYNITATNMTDFLGKIAAYRAVIESAHENTQAGKDARAEVKRQVKTGIAILKKIDKLMLQFDTDVNSDFFDAYTDSREIYDMGKGHKTAELVLEAGSTLAQTIFGHKFHAGDSFLFRNHGNEAFKAGLSSVENNAPETPTVTIPGKGEFVVEIPKDADIIKFPYLSVVGLNVMEKVNATIFLTKGKSHSKAQHIIIGNPK